MPQVILPAAVLAVLAFFCNLPLGRWRAATRKFSWQWFLAVHLSIPLILGLRLEMGVGPWFIPLSIGAALTGQLVGGRVEPQSNRAFRQK